MSGPERSDQGEIRDTFSQEAVTIVASHYLLLLIGPLAVGLLAYSVSLLSPPQYTSAAYLRIDPSAARSIIAIAGLPAVADKVLSGYPDVPQSAEAKIRSMSERIALVDLEPAGNRQSAHFFRLDLTHDDPRMAQEINSRLIDAWIETTRPGPAERADLEKDLERNKTAAALQSALIERLQKDPAGLVVPNSVSGEFATLISSLVARRDQNLEAIDKIENRLTGVSRDVVFASPDFPRAPSQPRKGIAVLAAALALPVILAFLLLLRRIKVARSR